MLHTKSFEAHEEDTSLPTLLCLLDVHIDANRKLRLQRTQKIIGKEVGEVIGHLSIYREQKIITWRDEIVSLRPINYNMVEMLLSAQGSYISREILAERLVAFGTTVDPRYLVRDLITDTRKRFRLVDATFDSLLCSKKKGAAWEI